MKEHLLTNEEIQTARHCLQYCLSLGAAQVRVSLNKSLMNLTGLLNGEVDKVSHALDRSLQLAIFADGRYGTFSSNRLEIPELEAFIREAVDTVRMLEPDSLRSLPDPSRQVRGAGSGLELGLYDPAYEGLDADKRRSMALESCFWGRRDQLDFKLVSEEGEYSDSVFDMLVLDSNSLEARHTETSFELGYESTVEDADGKRYSAYWWEASSSLKDFKTEDCARKAALRAAAQMHPRDIAPGKYNLIVDSENASKLVSPLVSALGGSALQLKNSFLEGKLGEKLFPECFTLWDRPCTPGATGSRLFDSEGVATADAPVIEKGVVKRYFLNTYFARKMQMEPTVEDVSRLWMEPVGGLASLDELLERVGEGILVTGFNGGNSNPATGNFSYGVEGFLVSGGKIVHPVREVLVTGDFIGLWNKLIATADDARPCMSRLIPSLAFKNVDFSA